MNYLAHALLAGPDVGLLVGGLAGDFVKGRLARVADPRLRAGVQLHRRIDGFTDRHPVCVRSRGRFSPERRRFAGVIVDIAYDHFLAVHWRRYSTQELDAFTAGVYGVLSAHHGTLPPRLRALVPRMIDEDWLGSYADLGVIERVLDRVAARLRRPGVFAGSGCEVRASYRALEDDFLEFFPAAYGFAKAERIALSVS